MIKPDMIPDEVVEAAARAMYLERRGDIDPLEWDEIGEWRQQLLCREARAAIAAALNAWPGVDFRPTFGPSRITLPLTQEGDA